jgi:hypothetical protein
MLVGPIGCLDISTQPRHQLSSGRCRNKYITPAQETVLAIGFSCDCVAVAKDLPAVEWGADSLMAFP